jgi:hypothetical protein
MLTEPLAKGEFIAFRRCESCISYVRGGDNSIKQVIKVQIPNPRSVTPQAFVSHRGWETAVGTRSTEIAMMKAR